MRRFLATLALAPLAACTVSDPVPMTPSPAASPTVSASPSPVDVHDPNAGGCVESLSTPSQYVAVLAGWSCWDDGMMMQGVAQFDLHSLPPAGTTAQGFTYYATDADATSCTNSCTTWRVRVVVVDVPAGRAGVVNRTVLVLQGRPDQAAEMEAYAASVRLV